MLGGADGLVFCLSDVVHRRICAAPLPCVYPSDWFLIRGGPFQKSQDFCKQRSGNLRPGRNGIQRALVFTGMGMDVGPRALRICDGLLGGVQVD